MLKSPLNSVPKLLTGKGPPINYVVSKLAIFDPLLSSYLSFYQVELAIFDPHPLSPCDNIVYGWPLNVKIQYWILCTNQSFLFPSPFYALVIKRSFFSACGCTAEKRIENDWFSNSFRRFMLAWVTKRFFFSEYGRTTEKNARGFSPPKNTRRNIQICVNP